MFTGTLQGVTGLFVKPISGVLDAASKTAEGVKNTALIFDKSEEKREREPRVFYFYEKCYDKYNDGDIEIIKLLKKIKKGKFAKNAYYSFKKFLPFSKEPNKEFLMIFTLEDIINYNSNKEKVEWSLPVRTIIKSDKQGGGLKIFLKEVNKKLKVVFRFLN